MRDGGDWPCASRYCSTATTTRAQRICAMSLPSPGIENRGEQQCGHGRQPRKGGSATFVDDTRTQLRRRARRSIRPQTCFEIVIVQAAYSPGHRGVCRPAFHRVILKTRQHDVFVYVC